MVDVIDGTTVVGFNPIALQGAAGSQGAQGTTGIPGAPASLNIGTIVTLPAGQSSSGSITGTPPNQYLNLQIALPSDFGVGTDDSNIDGGSAASVYTDRQNIDGGAAAL